MSVDKIIKTRTAAEHVEMCVTEYSGLIICRSLGCLSPRVVRGDEVIKLFIDDLWLH